MDYSLTIIVRYFESMVRNEGKLNIFEKNSVAQRLNLPDLRSGYTFGYDQDIRKNFVL